MSAVGGLKVGEEVKENKGKKRERKRKKYVCARYRKNEGGQSRIV